MSPRLSAQLSTGNAFPGWQCLIFHLATGCSRTCYLQGVQPGRFLALLCLLAVQGGQELPSHPETKEGVKGFLDCLSGEDRIREVLLHLNVLLSFTNIGLLTKVYEIILVKNKSTFLPHSRQHCTRKGEPSLLKTRIFKVKPEQHRKQLDTVQCTLQTEG